MDKPIHHPLSILLADDGSKHSQAASQLLSDLPLPKGSSIRVVSIIESENSSKYNFHKRGLEKTSELLERKRFEVTTELIVGEPAETIVDIADKHQVDLIIVGAKGLQATLGIFLGGVAQQVVEYANRPVLVVRAPYQQLRLILATTDGSSHSQTAVGYLAHFPLPKEAEVRVVHVLPPAPSPELYMRNWPVGVEPLPPLNPIDREEISTLQAEEEETGQLLLEKTLEKLTTFGVDASGELLRGEAANEIIDYSKTNKVDLIVSGSRGMSKVKSWLLGSISRKLVHYATCSVLIVRDQQEN